jgi:hypothetical protein
VAGVGVQRRRQPTEVPPVAQRQQREHPDGRVLGGVERARQAARIEPGGLEAVLRDRVPDRDRAQLHRRQVELDALEHLVEPSRSTS